MNKPSLKVPNLKNWYKTRKQKEEQQRNLESSSLKMVTFVVTLVAMALGMSFLSLFPQPLPILLAVLVAFVTFKEPRFGMPIGGAIIGLGLMYHLAELYFISFLGSEQIRLGFVVVWMALFVVLPVIFHRYKSALAIDFGILSVTMLFFWFNLFFGYPVDYGFSGILQKIREPKRRLLRFNFCPSNDCSIFSVHRRSYSTV